MTGSDEMEIKQSEREALMPFLDKLFDQQHEKQFVDTLPEADEKTLAFGAWVDNRLAGGVVGKKQYDTLHISLLGSMMLIRNWALVPN